MRCARRAFARTWSPTARARPAAPVDWLTVSPKPQFHTGSLALAGQPADELKVVVDDTVDEATLAAYDARYRCEHYFAQPCMDDGLRSEPRAHARTRPGAAALAAVAAAAQDPGDSMTARVVRMVTEPFHRDDEGRPLRESRTPAEFLNPGDIEHKKCPYHGGRQFHEKPMNVGALRQTSAHWDEITDALAVLRGGYVDARKLVDGPELIDLWRISQLGSALPWWFILRDQPLPAYAAALSKATLGVGIWAQQMLMRSLVGAWTEPVFTAANIMESVEETGTLIGTREVCAGSDKMLIEVLRDVSRPDARHGRRSPSRARRCSRFGAHYANFKLVMWLYFLARRYLYFDAGGTTDLLQRGAEPPDFFILEPQNPARDSARDAQAVVRRQARRARRPVRGRRQRRDRSPPRRCGSRTRWA